MVALLQVGVRTADAGIQTITADAIRNNTCERMRVTLCYTLHEKNDYDFKKESKGDKT